MLLRKHGPQIFVNPHGFKTCRYQRGKETCLQRILSNLRAIRTFTKYHMKMTCWIVYFMNSMKRKQGNCFIHLIELETLTMALASSIFLQFICYFDQEMSVVVRRIEREIRKRSHLLWWRQWGGTNDMECEHALHLLTANQISSLNKQLTDSLKGLLSSRRISHACKVVILLKIFGNTLDLPLEWLERTPQCFFVRFYKYSMRNGFSNGCDDINILRCSGKQY